MRLCLTERGRREKKKGIGGGRGEKKRDGGKAVGRKKDRERQRQRWDRV